MEVTWKVLAGIPHLSQLLFVLTEASIKPPIPGSTQTWAEQTANMAQQARSGYGYRLSASELAECDKVASLLDDIAGALYQGRQQPLRSHDFAFLASKVEAMLTQLDPNWHRHGIRSEAHEGIRRMYWD